MLSKRPEELGPVRQILLAGRGEDLPMLLCSEPKAQGVHVPDDAAGGLELCPFCCDTGLDLLGRPGEF